jgi:3-phytase
LLLHSGCTYRPVPKPDPPALEITYLASALLPLGTKVDSLDVGGISGLVHEDGTGLWLALSDQRESPRFYEIEVSLPDSGLTIAPRRAVPLEGARGFDTEGMVEAPGRRLLVSTEGDGERNPVLQPGLLEFSRDGALLRTYEVPQRFRIEDSASENGVRDNLGFESLAISPDGKTVFTGTEGTLMQDGAVAGASSGGFCRILVFAVEGDVLSPVREYAYPLGPFPSVAEFVKQDVSGGLVELISLGSDRLLALERTFIRELSGEKRDRNQARIFAVDLSDASDVSPIDSLENGTRDWRPVRKELLVDLDEYLAFLPAEYPRLDNLEAMGLGPELPDGGRELLLASDDNFESHQRTQFLLFRLKGG